MAEPEIQDGLTSVSISENQFQFESLKYKYALLGHLSFLPKAGQLSFSDLKVKLAQAWSLEEGWELIFLGKGLHVIKFQSEVVRRRIWAQGSRKLNPGVFRVSNWEPNFNLSTQLPLKVQVWIRLYTSIEYWYPLNLMEVAKAVGHPIKIDQATLTNSNGQFARILVEVDYNHPFTTDICIQRSGYFFWVQVFYERLPDLCDRC